jgi:hypothetical protein
VAFEVTLPAWLAGKGVSMYNDSQLSRTTPAEMSSAAAYEPLTSAAIARAAQIAPESQPLVVRRPTEYVPKEGETFDSSRAASHGTVALPDGNTGSAISINPNVDRAYYAHELGHGVSQKTKVGQFVHQARHKFSANPKMGKAIALALTGAVPGVAAALQAGDDDLAGSIALAAAMASPTLIDEALASKNALAVMNDAGMRATPGQRGRLAGGYLSYLAPVLIAGSVGNFAGNLVDERTALYDL